MKANFSKLKWKFLDLRSMAKDYLKQGEKIAAVKNAKTPVILGIFKIDLK